MGLDLVPIIGSVIVGLVQDQPNFEAGVGPGDTNPSFLATSKRFGEMCVFVAVEHRPHFISLLEGVSASRELALFVRGLLRQSRRITSGWDDLQFNERISVVHCKSVEISRLGIFTLAIQIERPLRFATVRTSPEFAGRLRRHCYRAVARPAARPV
jgi:hypothetical protein